ncbi:hypothetical protein BKA70DRAFT_1266442 [Coprinopsis sp. MPI-PUGE-AT-0042]|nr:hypothetical protein BKA70DRAFT_1266442 [Coprinopsis sp. MPI-PUGE-AT-0042]
MSSEPHLETREAIVQSADYHSELLSTISQLEYVVPSLKQHNAYVGDLENQIKNSEKKLKDLEAKTKKEKKEHEAIRDSTAKRLTAKLTGRKAKYEEKTEKEEREYIEALQNEMVEKDQKHMLDQLLAEAQTVKHELEEKLKKYDAAKKEVDLLYARIFDGPSQSFPDEDRLEYETMEAQKRYEQLQNTLNGESQAADLLARACVTMDRCQGSMSEALRYSKYDMWGGGTMTDYMERNALTQAQMSASRADSLVEQAVRISPNVRQVGRVNIPAGSIISDVFFDNIFTDMAFHEKIQNGAAQVLRANRELQEERNKAIHRRDAVGRDVGGAAQHLESRRKELFSMRKAIFESIAAGLPKPPSYNAAVDEAYPMAPPPVPNTPPPSFPEAQHHQEKYPPPSGPPPSNQAGGAQTPASGAQPQYPPPPGPPPGTGTQGANQPLSGHPPRTDSLGVWSPSGSQGGPRSPAWGSRNPYAAALAVRSDSGEYPEAPFGVKPSK